MSKNGKKKLSAFAIVVIVLAALLVGAIVAGVFIARGFVKEMVQEAAESINVVPAEPTPGVVAGVTEEPQPTATPSEDDREMPELDGTVPDASGNPSDLVPVIYESAAQSVVSVVNYQTVQGKLQIYGYGSGFIVSTTGYILTNAHVVEKAEAVKVKLTGGDVINAKVIGQDSDTDVAVLKVEHDGLKALALGNSDEVKVGEFVLAIGNPLDMERLANTLTFGIISAKSRRITIDGKTNNYLQTDAAINYGNSGGPLLNMRGEVIGINSAKSVTAGYDMYGNAINAEGIGFALPMNTVVEVMEQLIQNGSIERPAIGISVITLTEETASLGGMKPGVYVQSVVNGGPGAKAGLKAGDQILSVDGKTVADSDELIDIVTGHAIGDEITLRIARDGKEQDCVMKLESKTSMDYDDVEKTEPTDGAVN